MRLLLTYIIICISFMLQGQHGIRNTIKESFDNQDVWISEYSGLQDGLHRVKLYLADNGEKYIALTQYTSSGEVLNYDIVKKDDLLILNEINESGRESGYYELTKSGNDYLGSWFDDNGVSHGEITFYRTTKDLDCGDYHFRYLLKSRKGNIDVLRKDGKLTIERGEIVIDATCLDVKCNEIQIDNLKEHLWGKDAGILILGDEVIYKTDKQEITIDIVNSYIMTCQEYIDYDRKWSLEIPDMGNESFDQYLTSKINNYISSKPEHITSEKIISGRNEYQSRGWVEVSFIDDQYISGYVFFRDSENGEIDKEAYIYNIDEEEEVAQQDIIKADQELYEITELSYCVLTEEGLVFSGEFDPISGEQKLTISYKDAKQILKNKDLVKFAKENG